MAAVHPLLRLAVEQPQLLAEHLAAYAAVLADEGSAAAARLQRRLAWNLAAGAGLLLAAALAGAGAMLWAALPAPAPGSHWVLMVIPAVPALAALWALHRARLHAPAPAFDALRRHAAADLALLRESRVLTAPR